MTEEESQVKRCQYPVTDGCKNTSDLAQCPDCNLWFCREHDMHECFPERGAHVQDALSRRSDGFIIMLIGFVLSAFGATAGAIDVLFLNIGLPWAPLLFVSVPLFILGYAMWRHYNGQLRQLGVRFHGIRHPNR